MPELKDNVLNSLRDIRAAIEKEFPGAGGRLTQFQDHLDTVVMSVEHMFDEAERMPDAGYRTTPEEKAQKAVERQKVIDEMRRQGATI